MDDDDIEIEEDAPILTDDGPFRGPFQFKGCGRP